MCERRILPVPWKIGAYASWTIAIVRYWRHIRSSMPFVWQMHILWWCAVNWNDIVTETVASCAHTLTLTHTFWTLQFDDLIFIRNCTMAKWQFHYTTISNVVHSLKSFEGLKMSDTDILSHRCTVLSKTKWGWWRWRRRWWWWWKSLKSNFSTHWRKTTNQYAPSKSRIGKKG